MLHRTHFWFLTLLLIIGACPAHESGSRRGSSGDDADSESGGAEGGDGGEEGAGAEGGEGDTGSGVKIRHKHLRDAIRETSDNGRMRHNVAKLREALCEGREDQPKIFYHLIVSTHWHYYWICSDERPHRASSRHGGKSIKNWLAGFQRQAGIMSRACNDTKGRCLSGNHESGIEANAYCDGRIILHFPDGEQKTLSYSSQSGKGRGEDRDADEGGDEGGGGAGVTCPPCPPPVAGRTRCPDCPACRACPLPRECPSCPPPRPCPACPACPACPTCDCSKQMLESGKKGFRQGVEKACRRICDMIYKKCRSINPNTALCYQLTEFCSTECPK